MLPSPTRASRRFRSAPLPILLVGVFLVLGGCEWEQALRAHPRLDPRVVPVSFKEKWPLRAGLLLTQEDRDRTYRFSQKVFLASLETELTPGGALQDSILLSLSQQFERLTLVRTPPAPGAFEMVLIPKLDQLEFTINTRLADHEFVVALDATLRVLDETGAELARFKAEGRANTIGAVGRSADVDRYGGPLVSQAIGDVVRRWGEQLALSSEVERYVSRRLPLASAPAGAAPGGPVSQDVAVTFSHPAEGARVTDETIALVGLVSAARGIRRIDLTVNAQPIPISRDVRVEPTGTQHHPFNAQVPLRPGQNLVVVTAVDSSGQAVQAVRTVFREVAHTGVGEAAEIPSAPGERWAVVIGIDEYQDPAIAPLRYATVDAEAMFRFLTTTGGVKPANARLLLNRDATQRAIREVLGDFLRRKALRNDEIIIYYAGHGTTEPDASAEGGLAKYLVPWDADPEKLFSSGIPMEEIDRVFSRLAARKILLIQDTCFSGGAGGRTFLAKGLRVRSAALTDKFLQELTQKEGRMILAASDVNQVSQEDPRLQHGIFTYYFLEAVGGAADLDGDGAVTVREIHLYLQRRVHERSRGAQTPQLYNIGDMVLMRK